MGAIWGCIDFETTENNGFEKMSPVFNRKCKLDDVKEICVKDASFGYGRLFKDDELTQKDGIVIVADAVIDNGYKVSEAYAELGTDSFEKLGGLFSIAIWHSLERKLILVSDPVSARCLYYYRRNGSFYFSTLLEPIKAATGGLEVNTDYIEDFLMAPGLMPNLFSDDTPYAGVYKLNPGEWLEVTADEIKSHEYFDISKPLEDCKARMAEEYGKYFRALYEECVSDAVNSQGNPQDTAICMSSGLDSASVGVLAAKQLAEAGKKLKAYTYVPYFDDNNKERSYFVNDETEDVLEICRPYKNIENRFLNNDGKCCFEDLDEVVDMMEIPFKAFVNFPNLMEICKTAREEGCRVVLTGQTGNASVSAGKIEDVLFDLWEKKRFLTYYKILSGYCRASKISRKKVIRECYSYFKKSHKELRAGIKEYEGYNSLLTEEFAKQYPYKERFAKAGMKTLESIPMNEAEHRAFLSKKALYTYMGEYETKLGLRYGVLIRDCTKDVRILRFCYNLPTEVYANDGIPRWLVRGVLRDMLPEKLTKEWMRYGVQNVDWMKRVLRDWDKEQYGEKIAEALRKPEVMKYADAKKVDELMEMMQQDVPYEQEYKLCEASFLWIVGKFLTTG